MLPRIISATPCQEDAGEQDGQSGSPHAHEYDCDPCEITPPALGRKSWLAAPFRMMAGLLRACNPRHVIEEACRPAKVPALLGICRPQDMTWALPRILILTKDPRASSSTEGRRSTSGVAPMAAAGVSGMFSSLSEIVQ